jgi:hypothetical protein
MDHAGERLSQATGNLLRQARDIRNPAGIRPWPCVGATEEQ